MADGLGFRLGGIPVTVDPSFFVIAALLGFGGGTLAFVLTWVAVVFVSVLLHELGHAVAFRLCGQRPRILLQGMGGVTTGSAPLHGGREVAVSLAGPLSGLALLGLPAWWLLHSGGQLSGTWELVLRQAVFVNVAWSGVNLLPVLPLDGGLVSASLLRRFRGAAGEQLARVVSMVVAAAAAAFALRLNYLFGALFAGFFLLQNYADWRRGQATQRRAPLVAGYQALVDHDWATASSEAERVLAASPKGGAAVPALELSAWAALGRGDAARAVEVVEGVRHRATPNHFLTGWLALDAGRPSEALDDFVEAFRRGQSGPWNLLVVQAVARAGLADALAERLLAAPGAGAGAAVLLSSHLHAAGHFAEAASVGALAFPAGPPDPAAVAYDVACSWARAGHGEQALAWLERAAAAGLDDARLLESDGDLDGLRHTARYRAVLAAMTRGADRP